MIAGRRRLSNIRSGELRLASRLAWEATCRWVLEEAQPPGWMRAIWKATWVAIFAVAVVLVLILLVGFLAVLILDLYSRGG